MTISSVVAWVIALTIATLDGVAGEATLTDGQVRAWLFVTSCILEVSILVDEVIEVLRATSVAGRNDDFDETILGGLSDGGVLI